MNWGIARKAVQEVAWISALCGVILFLFQGILSYVLPTFQSQIAESLNRLPFVMRFLRAMLGAELADQVSPLMFTAIPWVHPVVLSIVWAHAIVLCTRVPAGEIERGTIDVLLSLPVSRWRIYRTETFVWLLSAGLILLAGMTGSIVGGSRVADAVDPGLRLRIITLANLFCLYFVVGAFAWLCSTLSDARGKAIAAAFLAVLVSFLMHYLAQFWEPAKQLAFLSVLSYYKPLVIFQTGQWPIRDIAVLSSAGLGLWLLAGWIFARRDLCTV